MSDERSPDSNNRGREDDVQAARDRDRTTDAVDRTESDTSRRRDAQAGEPTAEQRQQGGAAPDPAADEGTGDGGGGGSSGRLAFWASVLIGLALATGAVALVSGRAPFFENIMRVRPTVEGGGVGADWVVGNTGPILEAAITLVHLADVVMGIFILLMVFIHWAAFRRLAARMRPPAGSTRARESAAATDGGVPESSADEGPESGADGDSSARSDASSDGTDGGAAGADGGDRP